MIYSCPQCQVRLRLPEEAAGKRMRCSKCGHVFEVPPAADETPRLELVEETGIAAGPLPAQSPPRTKRRQRAAGAAQRPATSRFFPKSTAFMGRANRSI